MKALQYITLGSPRMHRCHKNIWSHFISRQAQARSRSDRSSRRRTYFNSVLSSRYFHSAIQYCVEFTKTNPWTFYNRIEIEHHGVQSWNYRKLFNWLWMFSTPISKWKCSLLKSLSQNKTLRPIIMILHYYSGLIKLKLFKVL